MPDTFTLVVAVAGTLLVALLVSIVIARVVQRMLRAIIADPHVETLFVDRPRRVVQLVIFLVTTTVLVPPALRYAGIATTVGGSPEALARWLLDVGLRIVVIAVAGYLAIRIGTAATRRFEREMSGGSGLDALERAKRAQTLGRLVEKTLSVVVAAIASLMILRELDVDITPVLTGAGIVGLAVGFGAQTLVRDVISGFFLLLEDQVRVGDVAVVNGQGGLVEAMNLRTIVLRDEEGTVHVFPNGEVKTLANRSKHFSYFVINVPISFEQDLEQVTAAMRDAGASLLEDTRFAADILAPMEIYGMESLEPGRFVVKGRIKTVPMKQWNVGRELRARIASLLKARNILMPTPTMHVYIEREAVAERPDGDASGDPARRA